MTELVDESLASFCFLHDSLFVILSYASRQFVVVHRGPVLSLAPESGDAHGILNLEHTVT